jgi:hypothetical protein
MAISGVLDIAAYFFCVLSAHDNYHDRRRRSENRQGGR